MKDRIIKDHRTRLALYLVAVAALGVAGVYGLITAEQQADYLQAIGLLLGVTPAALAAANAHPATPADEDHDTDY